MAPARDLYEVLGVPREASQDEIRRAFRALARQYHPDVNGDPEAEHRFKEINLAYETLSDPAKRRQYDTYGGEGFTPDMFGFGDVSDIFEAFFGGGFTRARPRRRMRARRGRDLHMVLEVAFEEAGFGVTREVRIQRGTRCERCGGTACEPGTTPTRCARCEGSGQVAEMRRSVFGAVMTSTPCSTCEGTGEAIASPCRACRGGLVAAEHTVTIDVPPGAGDGVELRLEGAGEDGAFAGPAGDLYATVRVAPHTFFERRGTDISCTLEVPLTKALLGADLEIETLDGTEVVRVEPGTPSGTTLRLRGRGIPNLGRRGRGDLLVTLDISIPSKLSRKERGLVQQLAELRGERQAKGPEPGRLRPLA